MTYNELVAAIEALPEASRECSAIFFFSRDDEHEHYGSIQDIVRAEDVHGRVFPLPLGISAGQPLLVTVKRKPE
jgi:hypothetical protein